MRYDATISHLASICPPWETEQNVSIYHHTAIKIAITGRRLYRWDLILQVVEIIEPGDVC